MPIEKSHIMMFARSIGDPNPIYYDEDHANNSDVGSIIAPPTFTQASAQFDPDYFLRPKIDGKGWFGSGKEPTGAKKEGSLQAVMAAVQQWGSMQNNILNIIDLLDLEIFSRQKQNQVKLGKKIVKEPVN